MNRNKSIIIIIEWKHTTMPTKKSQAEKLLTRLNSGKNLTVLEARNRFGIQRLAARIHELREEGMVIYTNKITQAGRKVTAYRLDSNQL